ncbi:bone morphogenetic protein 7-like [Apostichopus japonicus]|uniref:bone morphogenetic protein 7-like n=1 Tax=Stichopus japonicus TaxID=307972 RepID=UPI003AB76AD9
MATVVVLFPSVIFAAILICSPLHLEALPTNSDENSDGVFLNSVVNPSEHHHAGRISSSEGAATWTGPSPSSPSLIDANTLDRFSQIFGIRYQNRSGTKRKNAQIKKDGTPKFMLDLYTGVANSTNGETYGVTPYDATTIRSLMVVRKGGRSDRNILHFEVDTIPSTERLLRAELHLFRLISKLKGTARPKYYQVGIYQRTDRGKSKLVDQRRVRSRGTGREIFEVDSTLHEWLTDSSSNLGLYINVTYLTGEPAPDGAIRYSLRNVDRKPTLVIFTREETDQDNSLGGFSDEREGDLPQFIADANVPFNQVDTPSSPTSEGTGRPARRDKREIKAPYVTSGDLCRVERMFVDFERLGWSHRILAPEGFNANQCTGTCPFPANIDTPYSTHALITSFMAIESPQTVQSACCVPHELSHIAILYIDESNNIILQHVKNAIAVKCGCH